MEVSFWFKKISSILVYIHEAGQFLCCVSGLIKRVVERFAKPLADKHLVFAVEIFLQQVRKIKKNFKGSFKIQTYTKQFICARIWLNIQHWVNLVKKNWVKREVFKMELFIILRLVVILLKTTFKYKINDKPFPFLHN